MGKTWGAPRRNMVGNNYLNNSSCGSRSMYCNIYPYLIESGNAARGCSQKKIMERDSCIPLLQQCLILSCDL